MRLHGKIYVTDNEFFFVFTDLSPVHSSHVCTVLRQALAKLGLDPKLYNTHSFCGERAIDMFDKFGKSLEFIKSAGRWRSNVIYRYLQKF